MNRHTIDTIEANLDGYVLPALDGAQPRTWLDLVREVAHSVGVAYRDVISGQRTKSVTRARHLVWQRLESLGYSMNEIARRWGADHTTISAAIAKLERSGPPSQTRLRRVA